jgi:hypothetical protein
VTLGAMREHPQGITALFGQSHETPARTRLKLFKTGCTRKRPTGGA